MGQPPAALASIDEGLKAGNNTKPVVIFFLEYTQKCDIFEKNVLADKSVADTIGKVAYVKVVYKKDSEEAKKWKVSSTPTLLVIDASKDGEPKEVKRLTSGTPATIKKELETAIKKYEKK